jgi:hypothetical protein
MKNKKQKRKEIIPSPSIKITRQKKKIKKNKKKLQIQFGVTANKSGTCSLLPLSPLIIQVSDYLLLSD